MLRLIRALRRAHGPAQRGRLRAHPQHPALAHLRSSDRAPAGLRATPQPRHVPDPAGGSGSSARCSTRSSGSARSHGPRRTRNAAASSGSCGPSADRLAFLADELLHHSDRLKLLLQGAVERDLAQPLVDLRLGHRQARVVGRDQVNRQHVRGPRSTHNGTSGGLAA